ncbi:MAG: 50S ribosomal protein L24e [Candidatus Diapherotrites archaeon]|nr:50S ribosomal protein L24e [Candidatus Diapherotrites archaeon]
MSRCSFCGKDLPKGQGKMYVTKEGMIYYFCSSKCEKNQIKLNRVGKDFKWTSRYVKGQKR